MKWPTGKWFNSNANNAKQLNNMHQTIFVHKQNNLHNNARQADVPQANCVHERGGKQNTAARASLRRLFLPALAAGLLLAQGCSFLPKENDEEKLPPINPPKLSQKPVYEVKTTTLETKVRGIGKLMSNKEEPLFFSEDNKRVKEIYVKSGEPVEQGQLIAELDVSDLESQLKQKKLQARRDELQMIQIMRKSEQMRSAEELEQAKIDFQLKREELNKLAESIRRAKLTAPFSGTLVAMYLQKGQEAKAYETAAIVADLSQLTVAAEISAEDLKKVTVGMDAVVDINAAGQHKGKVKQLPNANRDTGNGSGGGRGYDPYNPNSPGGNVKKDSIDNYMLVELDPFPPGLQRGTPLSVFVITARKENALVIPAAALRSYAGRNYVQVVDEKGNKREVDVEIGQQTSTEVGIVKGLQAGEKVVGR